MRGMKVEKVSVIMAVYNGEDYLEESINSILQQTYPYFEFIIVNDGSSDGTAEILNNITDKRVKVYHLYKNRGVSYARNYAVKKANTRWLVLQDHDDISVPERIEVQLKYMQEHPELVAAFSMFQQFKEELTFHQAHLKLLQTGPFFTTRQLKERRFFCPWVCYGSALIARQAFLQAGGYDNSCFLGEDFDLFLRLMELGPVAMIPRVLYLYRYNPHSISKRNRRETRRAVIKISTNHILKMYAAKYIDPTFLIIGSPWDCQNFMTHIYPGTGMEIISCLDSNNDATLTRAFSLFKQKIINGIIVLGGTKRNRYLINQLVRRGMTLNINLFHLKKFRRKG